ALHSTALTSLSSPPPPSAIHPLSLHDALPICSSTSSPRNVPPKHLHQILPHVPLPQLTLDPKRRRPHPVRTQLLRQPHVRYLLRSEEHTSELQSRFDLVCRLLLEKKKDQIDSY